MLFYSIQVSRSTVRRLIDSDDEEGDDDVLSVLSEDDVDQLQGEPIEEPPIAGENRLVGGVGQGEGVGNREGEHQVEGRHRPEGGPQLGELVEERQVEGRPDVEIGLRVANGEAFRVGEGVVNDIAQHQDINSDRSIPPQKILREAIAKAKSQPGFENASVKVKSSLDQELRSDNPNFKVETEVNSHGVLLYKVSVDYTIEVKNENDEVIKMTLNRVFYSNAANEKEALLAIYNVAKGVKQQATAENLPNNALEQKLFTVTYARDSNKAVIGVRNIKGDLEVDLTPRSSGKTTFGRDIDDKGQVRLRQAREGEVEEGQGLSKQARLLRSTIEFTDVPILD